MRTLVAVAVIGLGLSGCGWCKAGEMRCDGNTAQMCGADKGWEDYQNCSAVSQTCSTAPADCSGYSGIACCH
jgi:hypothetical protein